MRRSGSKTRRRWLKKKSSTIRRPKISRGRPSWRPLPFPWPRTSLAHFTECLLMAVVSAGRRNTLILDGKDGVYGDESKISSRFHCGRENGVVGSLAAGGVAQSDWAGVWQAVIFHLLPSRTARGDSS